MQKDLYGALVLEDGQFYSGKLIGNLSNQGVTGEVVFNTAMSGYQEVITDPSYKNQIVCFTYPSIGNYGIYHDANESNKIHLSGIVVKEYCTNPSNYKSEENLESFISKSNIPMIHGLDTRALVRYIRSKGSIQGGIFYSADQGLSKPQTTDTRWLENCILHVKQSVHIENTNLATFDAVFPNEYCIQQLRQKGKAVSKYPKVAVLDFGIKLSILRSLIDRNIFPEVFPGDKDINQWDNFVPEKYDGFVFSNGPGDPSAVSGGIDNIKSILAKKKPILGICLGHQLLSIALGFEVIKMKFGHHGANHPVQDSERPNNFFITSQNHGFAVLSNELGDNRHLFSSVGVNLNDNSIESFCIKNSSQNIISTQYHPEAGPGPHDSRYIFDYFYQELMKAKK